MLAYSVDTDFNYMISNLQLHSVHPSHPFLLGVESPAKFAGEVAGKKEVIFFFFGGGGCGSLKNLILRWVNQKPIYRGKLPKGGGWDLDSLQI